MRFSFSLLLFYCSLVYFLIIYPFDSILFPDIYIACKLWLLCCFPLSNFLPPFQCIDMHRSFFGYLLLTPIFHTLPVIFLCIVYICIQYLFYHLLGKYRLVVRKLEYIDIVLLAISLFHGIFAFIGVRLYKSWSIGDIQHRVVLLILGSPLISYYSALFLISRFINFE